MALTADEMQDIVEAVSRRCYAKRDRTATSDRTAIEAAATQASDWQDANAANYVAGIPQPWKANSDVTDKNLLFAIVVLRKAGIKLGAGVH